MQKPANFKWKLLLFVPCAVILGVWVILGLPCPFRQLTGLICPGCGMSRAWLAALRLDIAGAFAYHPLFFAVPFVVLFLFYDCKPFANNWFNLWCMGVFLGALTICYIVRLLCFLSGNLPL